VAALARRILASGRPAARAPSATAIQLPVPLTGGHVQEIRMFFVFIDFQRKNPPLP